MNFNEEKKYTDLIFDLYGTLADIRTDENDAAWQKTALFFGFYGANYSPAELKNSYAELLQNAEISAGQNYECFPEIQIEKIFSALFERKTGKKNSARHGFMAAQIFRISSIDYIRLYPDAAESLARLKSAGFRLWLLSNAQRAFTFYELNFLGIKKFFRGIFISSDYGCKKPDAKFFDALLDGNSLCRKNCLMIGNDSQTDIAGAKNSGVDSFYISSGISPAEDKGKKIDATFFAEECDWKKICERLLSMKK